MSVYGWGLVCYLFILLGVGYFAGTKVKNMDDYLVAGRSAGKILLLGTFVATFTSASIWIGGTGFYYKFGWSQLWQGPGTVLGPVLMIFAIGPYIRRFAQFTVPDFLEARYQSRTIRLVGAITTVLLYYAIMVAQAMGGARTLEMALNWDYKFSLIAICTIFIAYTFLGGNMAVIYTDTFQFFVILIGSMASLIYCLVAVGGLGGLNAKLAAISPSLVRGDGGGSMPLSMAGAYLLIWGFGNAAQPYTITRYYTAKDARTAAYSTGIGALAIACFWVLVGVVGGTARVLYPNLKSIDLAYPAIATNLLPVPIGILMICALIAAIISTVDSLLVTVGATIGRDIYQQCINPQASKEHVLLVSRWGTLVLGAVALVTAFKPPGPVLVVTTFAWSVLASSFFVPLVCGIHWKRGNACGAIASMLGGGASSLFWFVLNKPFGVHPVLVGVLMSAVFMVGGSLLTKQQDVSELWALIHPRRV